MSLYFIFLATGGVHPFRKLHRDHGSTPDLNLRITVPTNRRLHEHGDRKRGTVYSTTMGSKGRQEHIGHIFWRLNRTQDPMSLASPPATERADPLPPVVLPADGKTIPYRLPSKGWLNGEVTQGKKHKFGQTRDLKLMVTNIYIWQRCAEAWCTSI